ncbi:MAG: hypothetical protein US98_C0059G0009 [Parcubacteria group bacterium GW2011_GWC1_38_6]|uniref:TNase-like domain-containing protein n=2 Tax=Microgenomates group TaxID=1794810 RepID=A0A0G0WG44_9BACT|nr:MAG: hypothetical protein US98_C0059G0009 [Parcubacteria group bacterium GW2011_GWC1_38_6]KKS11002.1 MAG: hypothetical protein UU67_C0088G0002 [Candidatus Daviesbacteria bacterium GW2011_GWB1_41_5]
MENLRLHDSRFHAYGVNVRVDYERGLANVIIGRIRRKRSIREFIQIEVCPVDKDAMKTKKINTNKLVLVPATLLVALLSFLGGTQYEKQVKDILEQPNISTTTVRNLPTKEKVKRVIDGDTIELANGQIVRYVGINAPNNGEPFEEEATEANQKLVQGKTLTFEYDTYTSDRFGRILAYPMVNEKNVVVELTHKGLVKVTIYQDRRKLKYQGELLKAQDEAKQKKRGIWNQ